MTVQEQQMLQGLVDNVNRTELADKDADAEQLIQKTLGQNPDALYVMAQTVLAQGYALEQAQRQIADLRGQVDRARADATEPKRGGSFPGMLMGRHEPQPGGRSTAIAEAQPLLVGQNASAGYGPGLVYPSGGYPIAGVPAQGNGFLQSAMQTAAGVSAGALAFEGIESLMRNYYGDAAAEERGGAARYGNGVSGAGSGDQADDGTNADELSGTACTDYSAQGDDSMLADDVGSN